MDADAVARTGELAARLEFDLTAGARLPLPGLLRRDEPAIAELARVCNRAFEARYGRRQRPQAPRPGSPRRGARADRRARARRLLPAPLGGARARRASRAGGARPRLAAALAAAGPRARQLGRLARLLPDRPLARRPRRGRPLARALPQPRARLGARHRPRLPARHPREADRRAHRALRPRARRARRELLDLPLPRRDPRPRQGARPPVRRARAARARHRGEPEARRGGDRRSSPTASEAPLAPLARARACSRARSPACRATSPSTRAGWSSRPARSIELVPVQPAAMEGRQICQWDKDSCADAGFLKIDLLGLGMLSAVEDCVDQIARLHGETIDLSRIPLDDPDGLRGDPARRHRRRLPDREPRADAEPAAHAPRESRRPDRPGRARPAGADPGQGRPSVHRAPPAPARGSGVRPAGRPSAPRRAAPRDARRRRLPGPGARGGDRARRVQRGGGGRAAARDEPQAERGGDRGVPRRASSRVRVGKGVEREHGARDLRQARRLLGLRLPEVARGRVRAARLPVGLAAAPLSGRVPLRAAERAADGLLPAGEPRPRRAAARGGGAPAARQP